jgi:hypothetical protein
MLGYYPGTAVGAAGERRWDALWGGVLGMLVGVGIFSEVYPLIKDNLLNFGDIGKLTIPGVVGVNHWIIIAIVCYPFQSFNKVLFRILQCLTGSGSFPWGLSMTPMERS